MHLEKLTSAHMDAVLEFEKVNRDYFAAAIPDRGDDFFADYPTRHAALLRSQVQGTDLFHLVVMDDGTIAGRVNLVNIRGGEAEIGYRVGRDFAGRGVATEAVRLACHLAGTEYGLRRLRAETYVDNHGSRKVLLRNGFRLVDETAAHGRAGLVFLLDLTPPT